MQENNYIKKNLQTYILFTIILPSFFLVYIILSSFFNYSLGLAKLGFVKNGFDRSMVLIILLQFFVNFYIFKVPSKQLSDDANIIKINRKIYFIITILFPIFWIIIALFIGFILHYNKQFLYFVKYLMLLLPIQIFINILIVFFYIEKNNK